MAKKNPTLTTKFTTSRGHEVTLRPLPVLAMAGIRQDYIDAKGEYPKPPTYETPVGEVMPHNETTLETDEDKAAYEAYEEAAAEWEQGFVRFQFDYIGLESVVFDDTLQEEMKDWESRRRAMRVALPEDEYERKLGFLRAEVFTTLDDIQGISKALASLTGISEGDAKKLTRTFRG